MFQKMFKAATDLIEKKRRQKEQQRLERDQKIRLEDLERKLHRVGNVSVPFPSVYALKWLDTNISPLDDLDVQNIYHLGAIIFILENQSNVDELALMDKEAIDHAVNRLLSEISVADHYKYMLCVTETLHVIKKKFVSETREILERELRQIQQLLVSSPD